MWTTAHLPDEKVLAGGPVEHEARQALKNASAETGIPSKTTEWLDRERARCRKRSCARGPATPASLPARRMGSSNRQSPVSSVPSQRKKRERRRSVTPAVRGNLYLMFIEAALAVSHDNGIVELIVPNSITFRRSQGVANSPGTLRKRSQVGSPRERTTTYRSQCFRELPWVKTLQSRQHKEPANA